MTFEKKYSYTNDNVATLLYVICLLNLSCLYSVTILMISPKWYDSHCFIKYVKLQTMIDMENKFSLFDIIAKKIKILFIKKAACLAFDTTNPKYEYYALYTSLPHIIIINQE